ncbi:MAG: MmgE/PrpD family protein [Betaproteobacteria bacterium]|nr:MmgE/PrpD family protein [Betaproteobacteria bacterium]
MDQTINTGKKLSQLAPDATRRLAQFAANLKFSDLPQRVLEHTKLLALDAIGCCLYGSSLPWTRKLMDIVRDEGGSPRATVIGGNFKTSASQAVLVNSTAGHAFECDDTHRDALFHPGSICLPVALACGEAEGGRSGRDVITAMVAGYEVGTRVGMAGTMGLFFRGWHPQGTSGTFVSGATAARMLNLNADQAQDALGIAGTQASGLMAAQEGAMVKRMHSGRAAQSGVYGALLARRGFTGIKNVIEADFGGFLSTLSDKHDTLKLTQGLGTEWETLSVGLKPFSSVAAIHNALDALRQIMQENKLKAEDIARLHVGIGTFTYVHCAWEYKAQGVTAAQMNLFFGLAAIAHDGDAFVEQYREDRLRDPKLLDFIKRIEATVEKEIDDMGAPFRQTSRITVHTKDGRKLYKEVLRRLGSPENPLSQDQVYRKFGILTRNCLTDKQRDDLMAIVRDLDRLDDLGKLTAILAPAQAK